MASRIGGYYVFMIRATVPRRMRRLLRLDSLDTGDLLELVHTEFSRLGPRLIRTTPDEGFRVRELAPAGRSLFIKVRQGPLGAPGEIWDMDIEQATELTEKQAALSELRGLLVVPSGAYFGLLFAERVARRHVKDILRDQALAPIELATGLLIRPAAFADGGDWRRDLEGKQALRVSQVLRARTSADSPADADDTILEVSVEGAAVRARTAALKERILRRADRKTEETRLLVGAARRAAEQTPAPQGRAFAVDDDQEIAARIRELEHDERSDTSITEELEQAMPSEPEGFEHKRWEVQFGQARPNRTFVMERGSMPQFFYEVGTERLRDRALKDLWVAHAERIYRDLDQTLPRQWAEGGWPRPGGRRE